MRKYTSFIFGLLAYLLVGNLLAQAQHNVLAEKAAKQYEKLFKNLKSPGSTKKTIDNRIKKIDKQIKESVKTGAKATAHKTKEEVVKKSGDETQKKIRGVKD